MKLILIPFPDEFEGKGMYRKYSPGWDFIGFTDQPQYPGHQPERFPLDAMPVECFLGGYLRAADCQ